MQFRQSAPEGLDDPVRRKIAGFNRFAGVSRRQHRGEIPPDDRSQKRRHIRAVRMKPRCPYDLLPNSFGMGTCSQLEIPVRRGRAENAPHAGAAHTRTHRLAACRFEFGAPRSRQKLENLIEAELPSAVWAGSLLVFGRAHRPVPPVRPNVRLPARSAAGPRA